MLDCLHISYLFKGYLVKGLTTCKRTTKIISAISLYFKWMKVRITILRNLKFEVGKEKQLSQIQPGYWVALAAGDCVPIISRLNQIELKVAQPRLNSTTSYETS